MNPSGRKFESEEFAGSPARRRDRSVRQRSIADGVLCHAAHDEAGDYLKWIALKISELAGFSGTEDGTTRMEASHGTLAGGRHAWSLQAWYINFPRKV